MTETLKLEVGNWYELNNGEVGECEKMLGDDPLRVDEPGYGPFVLFGWRYHQDGRFGAKDLSHVLSIKREVPAPDRRTLCDGVPIWRDMTPEEKGALLLALHEGKVIQVRRACYEKWCDLFTPDFNHDSAYRVKPEPKRETVTSYWCPKWGMRLRNPIYDTTHRITFDIVDGEPDCASVRMEEL